MTTTPKGIENAELIESIFGSWPSFHDAEIHELTLTRDCDSAPQMDIKIHHWQMTGEVDAKGYYILKHHTLTTLRFSAVNDLQMSGFNKQNVLWNLEISEDAPSTFSVSMPTSFGCEASFTCAKVRVMSAIPYTQHDV